MSASRRKPRQGLARRRKAMSLSLRAHAELSCRPRLRRQRASGRPMLPGDARSMLCRLGRASQPRNVGLDLTPPCAPRLGQLRSRAAVRPAEPILLSALASPPDPPRERLRYRRIASKAADQRGLAFPAPSPSVFAVAHAATDDPGCCAGTPNPPLNLLIQPEKRLEA